MRNGPQVGGSPSLSRASEAMPLSVRVHLPFLAWVVLGALQTGFTTGAEPAGTECAHCPAATVVDISTTRIFFSRIPKCGTTSMQVLMNDAARLALPDFFNQFEVSTVYNVQYLRTRIEQAEMVGNFR